MEIVRAKKHNHYLSYSKLLEVDHGSIGDYKRVLDNGRLQVAQAWVSTTTSTSTPRVPAVMVPATTPR